MTATTVAAATATAATETAVATATVTTTAAAAVARTARKGTSGRQPRSLLTGINCLRGAERLGRPSWEGSSFGRRQNITACAA